MKLAYARFMQQMTNAAIQVQGATGMLADPDLLPRGGVWTTKFLHAPSLRIAGGSDQVQGNIIGERVLGLPPEARADKDIPFRDLPKALR
jgi:alkylation response protein AidB-like acyl-CoA dehydrogenase